MWSEKGGGGFQFIQDLDLLGVYFDAVVVFIIKFSTYCAGFSLSDQHIFSPINPNMTTDFVRFIKIYTNCSEIQNTSLKLRI